MLRAVLIADDSRLIQHMLQVLLAGYRGTRIVTATDGARALEVLSQEPDIDLILLDINMPVMNGIEVLERLARDTRYQRIPVIVVTTEGEEQTVSRCLAMGAKGYVRKPVDAPHLYKLIEELTGTKPTDRRYFQMLQPSP
jgi:two-component system chemotaxis response regulator CheY